MTVDLFGQRFLLVEPQVRFARLRIGAMTFVAMVRQNRPHVAGKLDDRFRGNRKGGQ